MGALFTRPISLLCRVQSYVGQQCFKTTHTAQETSQLHCMYSTYKGVLRQCKDHPHGLRNQSGVICLENVGMLGHRVFQNHLLCSGTAYADEP